MLAECPNLLAIPVSASEENADLPGAKHKEAYSKKKKSKYKLTHRKEKEKEYKAITKKKKKEKT